MFRISGLGFRGSGGWGLEFGGLGFGVLGFGVRGSVFLGPGLGVSDIEFRV